jgi:hypothetical protein
MENVKLRHDYHGQLIGCLEQAGFIGDGDNDDDDDDDDEGEENGSDCGCDDEASNPKGIQEEEKKPSPTIAPPTTLTAATERAITTAQTCMTLQRTKQQRKWKQETLAISFWEKMKNGIIHLMRLPDSWRVCLPL